MRVLAYDVHSYDREFQEDANGGRHDLRFTTAQLDPQTAMLARGFPAVCIFVNDDASAETLERLAAGGTRLIAQRSMGFNDIDLAVAERPGITCMRVSAYSPYAVAEFAVSLLLTVNRRIHRAYNRTGSSTSGWAGSWVRIFTARRWRSVGAGKIGLVFATILKGAAWQRQRPTASS